MNHLKFYIVDVFAERKYAGNQLAVVRGAASLSDGELQQIALEMNYSETTFIASETPAADDGYAVRIFTPYAEIPFAGHPTLGTAYIISEKIIGKAVNTVRLNLKAGQVPVDFPGEGGEGILWMTQLPPVFGETFDPAIASTILNIEPADIDTRFPVQIVSTGTPFILAPLKSLAAVRRARLNRTAYDDFISDKDGKSIFFFAPETYSPDNHINARLFADFYGISEDPATGSANGCLAGYLARHRYFGSPKVDVRVEQGMEINRPSLLYLQSEDQGSNIRVRVGGKVIPVAEGKLY